MVGDERRILIVEDERAMAHALELKLAYAGFQTSIARSGQEAVDAVHGEHFDLMILDLMLPVLDGFEVMAQLQEYTARPAVVVLTNLAQLEDEERAMMLGAKGYYVKSLTSLNALVEDIKRL